MVLLGTALFEIYAFNPLLVCRSLKRFHVVLASLVLGSGVVWLGLTLVDVTEDARSLASSDAWNAFFQASFGRAWLIRLALLVPLPVIAICRLGDRSGPLIIAIITAALLISQAWLSHAAAAEGSVKFAAIVGYIFHVLAAGAWLGGLFPLLFLLKAEMSRPQFDSGAVCAALQNYSRMALVAVGMILLSGLGNACLHLGSPAALISTSYGRTLALKLTLFAAVLCAALVNRFVLLPRILRTSRNEAVGPLMRNVCGEQVLGVAIVGLATLLASLPHE